MNDLLLRAQVVVRTSSMKSSRRHLADYIKKLYQRTYPTYMQHDYVSLIQPIKSLICDVVVAVAVVVCYTP